MYVLNKKDYSLFFNIPFTSAILITGKNLLNKKKQVKNNPNEPKKIPISTIVGEYITQPAGKYSLCNEVTIITKRSNHIPTFTTIDNIKMNQGVVRAHLNQNTCGAIKLQVIILQYAHQYGPVALLMKAYCSYSTPE